MALLPLSRPYKTKLIQNTVDLFPSTALSDFLKRRLPQAGEEREAWLYPGLCLACCAATGGRASSALPAATTTMLLYQSQRLWAGIDGEGREREDLAQTINMGDALLALAHLSLLRAPLQPHRLLRAERLFNQTCLKLCQAQHIERTQPLPKGAEERIVTQKAALLAACFGLGALFGPQARSWKRLANFGQALGTAFYLRDITRTKQAYDQALAQLSHSGLPPPSQRKLQAMAHWLLGERN